MHQEYIKRAYRRIDRFLLESTLEGPTQQLSQFEQRDLREERKRIERNRIKIENVQKLFEENQHILGCVVGASGYRLKNVHGLDGANYPTRFDWALIRMDSTRQVSNKVSLFPP